MEQFWQDNSKDDYVLYETLIDIQSARKYPLFNRESGQLLRLVKHGGILDPGDMVIIDRVDRCFRSIADGGNTMDYWKKHGIMVRIRDLGNLDMQSITGEIVVTGMIMAAHVESLIKSQRAKERHEEAARNGTAGGITGYRMKEVHGQRKPVIQRDQVELMELIAILRLKTRLSWDNIRVRVERDWCAKHGKPFNEEAIPFHKFHYSRQKVQKAFRNYWLFRDKFPGYVCKVAELNEHYSNMKARSK